MLQCSSLSPSLICTEQAFSITIHVPLPGDTVPRVTADVESSMYPSAYQSGSAAKFEATGKDIILVL